MGFFDYYVYLGHVPAGGSDRRTHLIQLHNPNSNEFWP